MKSEENILEFENVFLDSGDGHGSALCEVNITLRSGDLLLVLLDREHLDLSLADAASGLISPSQVAVRFLGKNWGDMRVDNAAALRSRIGRLFDEQCWIAHLDMDENLTLAQRHHTRHDAAELHDEAAELSQQFQLPGLPLGKPDGYRTRDLRKAACVRAFMGKPTLILLERPTHDIYADVMPALANAVFAARRRGAAVIWTTEKRYVWDDAGLKPTQRVRVSGARLHGCESDE